MREFSIVILVCILISIILEPLIEIVEITREKAIISSAMLNACRASKTQSIDYLDKRDLQATVDNDKFYEYFATAFEDGLDVVRTSSLGNTMVFRSFDGKLNDIEVQIELQQQTLYDDQRITKVNVIATTQYKYKTKYLKLVEEKSSTLTDHIIKCEQGYIVSIIN